MRDEDFFRIYFFAIFGESKTIIDVWKTPTVLQTLSYLEYKKFINEEIEDVVKRIETENRLRYMGGFR